MTAKLAYYVSRRNGNTVYLARVRLFNRFAGKDVSCGSWLGMGDTRQEAEADAVRYTEEQMQREGLVIPTVENIGKLSHYLFEHPYFGKAN